MYFNENKYKKCIKNLISFKADLVAIYLIIFAVIGSGIGFYFKYSLNFDWKIIALGASIGAIVGLIIGIFSTWRIEMKIQEAYWKIDTLNELKKQSSIANKNIPFAKTVVAIENHSTPQETKINNK